MAFFEAVSSKIKHPLLQRMLVYAFSDGVSRAMPFLVFPIVAFYLSQEEFGLVANFSVLTAILGPFVGMSTYSALSVDYYKKSKEELPAFYANLLYTNLLLFALVFLIVLFSNSYIELWTGYSLSWQMLAMISVFFGPFASLFSTRLRLEERAKRFGQYQVFNSAVAAILTYIFVAVLLWSWQGRIYSLVFSSVMPGLVAIYFTVKFIGGRLPKLDISLIKATLLFGLPLLPHNLSFWLKSGFEKLLVTSTQGLAENGIMAFAQTLSSIFVLITTAFFGAYSPYLFKKLSDSSGNEISVKIGLVNKSYLFLLSYFIILLLGYFVCYILVSMYFDKYALSLNYLVYFLGFNFFNACYAIFSGYLFYSKNTKFLGIITISTAFLQVGLSIFLVNYFGGIGTAYSTFIVSIITALVVAWFSNKKYPMPWLYFIKR
jgi:O-antigen/teichoic acid export membrane protein